MRAHPLTLAIFAAVLVLAGRVLADPPANPVRDAAQKSLALLQKSAAEYTVQKKCFSCHHQAMPVLAMTTAKARGFAIDDKEIARQLKFTADFLEKNRENYEMGKGQGGQADTAGYALLTLHAGGWKADATTSAVIEYLLLRDKNRDFWQATSQRPPSEASALTTTFVALSALKNYGPESKKEDMERRLEKVGNWLKKVTLKDTEDRVFHLHALKVLGADDKYLLAASEELIKKQRKDGGWAQIDKLDSDAYATGSVLVALHQTAGLNMKDDVYQRGVQFLLKTQRPDGSWHVQSRSRPFQTYFESGFPHGKDQWISCSATSWATMALVLTCEP